MPKLRKVGNSFTVTIPREIIQGLELKAGDELDVRARGGLVELVPIVRRERLRPEIQRGVDYAFQHFNDDLRRLAE